MPSNTTWKLIQQYVTGNCSPQSRHKLEQWMSQDPANRKLVEEVESIWRLTPDEQFDVNVQEAWSRFYRKEIGMEIVRDRDSISGDTQLKDIKLPARSRESALRPPSLMMHVLRAAAVFLVAAFAGYFTHATISEKTQTEQSRGFYVMQEMVTDSREKASVSFSDGTEVILNSASSLRFPEGFDGSTREIYLDGEAYFDVAHHAGQPFIVHTEDATIKVLGTKFNVQAWSEDIHADIAVREGKVAVSSTADLENSEEVILSEGEFTKVRRGKNPLSAQSVNVDKYLLWTSGGLYFDNTPLRTVLRQIERRYKVIIDIRDEDLLDVSFTSTFYEAELDEVLTVIAASMEMEYTRQGQQIEFSGQIN